MLFRGRCHIALAGESTLKPPFAPAALLMALCVLAGQTSARAALPSSDSEAMAAFRACETKSVIGLEGWLDRPIFKVFNSRLLNAPATSRNDVLAAQVTPSAARPLSWQPVASALSLHEELWAKAGLTLPDSGRQVRILSKGYHWLSVAESRVAVRAEDGVWRITRVTVENYGLPQSLGRTDIRETTEIGRTQLSPEDSSALDALIADPCLRAEPTATEYSYRYSSGDPFWTLEIAGQDSLPPMQRLGSSFGRTALIHYLLNRN